ncbi:MAG: peptidoglycan-binding domain-containing protein [Clostridiaceae bacterium]|nr:peptidoglycan-binding domain-containing protein [Clostridiaceae bacterium]
MRRGKILIFLLVLIISLTSVTFADTLKYGSRGAEVKKLQEQLKKLGYFSGSATGYFGSVTKAAVRKFQASKGATVDGIVGKETSNALYGTGTSSRSAASRTMAAAGNESKIEMLDWWKEANTVFSIGTTADVTDVRTGKSFTIVRTYGGNHADCEAATLEDSKIIKGIWGGNWSWSRRPIIIEVDGRKLAASMAAMPHAGVDSQPANKILSSRSQGYGRGYNLDKIKNNGMDGVVDVHFLNSRTHGTNKVDANHQKAVKEAAASGK